MDERSRASALHNLLFYLSGGGIGRKGGATTLLATIRLACSKGLLYPLLISLAKEPLPPQVKRLLNRLLEHEGARLELVRRTLRLLMETFESSGVDYLFIKLYRGVDYLPRDIDVFVRRTQLLPALRLLRERGFSEKISGSVEVNCVREGYLKVDIYTDLVYAGLRFLDVESLWGSRRYVEMAGLKFPTLDQRADLWVTALHIALGHRYLSLLDYLYLRRLLRALVRGREKMLDVPIRYGWAGLLLELMRFVREIDKRLASGGEVAFPLPLPLKAILREGLKAKGANVTSQVAFLASALLDKLYCKYRRIAVTYGPPKGALKALAKLLFKVREAVGDRTAM